MYGSMQRATVPVVKAEAVCVLQSSDIKAAKTQTMFK